MESKMQNNIILMMKSQVASLESDLTGNASMNVE
jgi:hypothetical protein